MSSTALAGALRFIGYDTGAIATANSEVTYGSGIGVLATNPALMSRFDEQLSVNLIIYKSALAVELMQRPAAADISFIIYDTNVTRYADNPDRPVPTVELRKQRADNRVNGVQTYLTAGITHSFGLKGFRLGALVALPLVKLISIETFYPDEREQHFTNTVHFNRFGEWSPIAGGMLGVSYMPVKYISLGIGAQFSATAETTVDIYIPEATVQDYALVKNHSSLVGSVRPIVGLQVEPLDLFAISLVWKWNSYILVDGTGKMNLWKFHEGYEDLEEKKTVPKRVTQKFKFAFDYEPMELTLGFGFNYQNWRIQASSTWMRWSDYLDVYNSYPQNAAAYPDGLPSVNTEQFGFSDTFSVNIGTTYRYLEHFESKAGFAYRPSPVPAQVGRTSYADSDVFCISLGQRFDFPIAEHRFFAELGLQFWWMNSRTTHKDPELIKDEFPDDSVMIIEEVTPAAAQGLQTNNPGYPGYTQKGWMLVTAASFGYKF